MGSTYFPSLDKVLAGESRLIPWRTASQLLTTIVDADTQNETLRSFLTDKPSLDLLTNAYRPFPPPSAESKRDFENRTAPIHVSPNGSGDYDVEQMKQDALWLAKELEVEEVTALRAVVLEWQERRADLLLGRSGPAGGQMAGEWAQALGASTMSQNRLDFRSSKGVLSVGPGTAALPASSDESVRRSRIIRVALEEKSAVSAVSATLKGLLLATGDDTEGRASLAGVAPFLGHKEALEPMMSGLRGTEFERTDAASTDAYITAFDERMRKLDAINSWPKAIVGDPVLEALYMDSGLCDAVNDLRTLLAQVVHTDWITEAQTLRDWFRIMDEYAFLSALPANSLVQVALVPSLQSLASVVSVALLKLPESLAYLQEAASARPDTTEYPDLRASAYIAQKPNNDCMRDITLKLADAADKGNGVAGPAIYVWGIITSLIRDVAKIHSELRLEQEGEDDHANARPSSARPLSAFEQQLEQIKDVRLPYEIRDDPPIHLARTAVDALNVYGTIGGISATLSAAFATTAECPTAFYTRLPLLDLIGEALPMVTYGEEVMGALLDLLDPKTPSNDKGSGITAYLVNKILTDEDGFRELVINQAIARYPYELSPFVRLCTLLCENSRDGRHRGAFFVMDEILETMVNFTTTLPAGFNQYQLTREDEDINAFILTDNVSIFTQRKAGYRTLMPASQSNELMLADGQGQDGNVRTIPQGTLGLGVNDARPGSKSAVVRLEHAHSSMAYLGLLLMTVLPKSEMVFALPGYESGVDRSTAAEIITLATALLPSEPSADARDHAELVIQHFSKALPDKAQGLIFTITNIFELELLSYADQSQQQESSLELLIACLDFFHRLLPTHASRVWSLLSRSSLVGLLGGAPALVAVVSSVEVSANDFTFLSRCACFYKSLVEDSITGVVKNQPQTPSNGRMSRHDSGQDGASTATSERAIAAVLGSFQRVMLDVFQSLPEWKHMLGMQRCRIVTELATGFEMVLRCTYGIDAGKDARKITAFLQPSASAILDAFAPEVEGGVTLSSITSLMQGAMVLSEATVPGNLRALSNSQTREACGFLTTLLRSARLQSDVRALGLANSLLKPMPAFASLAAGSPSLKKPIVVLLTEIVPALELSRKEPLSLLSQMGSEAAKSFLATLTQLDRPFLDVETECSCWNFLSTTMDSKQQGFSLFLLTGTLPKERIKSTDSKNKGRPLLGYALDQLTDLNVLEPERAISKLAFIAASQRSWVWASNEVRSHSTFLKNSIDWLDNLQAPKRGSGKPMLEARELRMATHICDILAVSIHSGLEVGDMSVVKMLVPKLAYLRDHGVRVDTYNRSLHQNLSENFASRYSGYTLQQFERTAANPPSSGDETYRGHFDTGLASRVLSHDLTWWGRKGQGGYRDEMERANANLALVDAQTSLLQAWRNLATTLSQCIEQESQLRTELAVTAEKCLQANLNAPLDEPGAADLLQVRIQMAFLLISKLVAAKCEGEEMKSLLPAAWNLVRASPVDFDVATAAEDLSYYRTLLQVLYLTLQIHIYIAPTAQQNPDKTVKGTPVYGDPATAQLLIQISHTVCAAFRSQCANLHNSPHLTQPADFALLTALFRSLTCMNGTSRQAIPDISQTVATTFVVRAALSLYSWSDRLPHPFNPSIPSAEDPVYATLALNFLLALSNTPHIANQMATEGLLTDLAAANLSSYFRKPGGKGPLDHPARMFVVWNEGFLPLCLNLLDHVGARIAPEVAVFLNGFGPQLKRAETAFANRSSSTVGKRGEGALTLGLVQEANTLGLISAILQSDSLMAAAEGVDAGSMEVLAWDGSAVREVLGVLRQRGRRGLGERLVAVDEREEVLARLPAKKGEGSALVEVVEEEVARGLLGGQ